MFKVVETKYLKQLPHILGAVTLLLVSAALAGALAWQRSNRPASAPIYDNAVLVVFETNKCEQVCFTFRKTIGRPYSSTATAEQVPLRYYDVSDGDMPKRYLVARDVGDGPTAVMFDVYGRESARWAGVPDTVEKFENFVRPHLKRAQRDLNYAATQGHSN